MRKKSTGEKAKETIQPRKTVRLGVDLTQKLDELAATREMSFSAVVRTAVEVYLQREEFAAALDQVEERLAGELLRGRKETFKVAEDVQLLIAIVDQLTQFLMITTPEVIDKEGATAVGNRRHAAFIAELHKAFNVRRKRARITQQLDEMGDANGE